jgi:hypothetical protein
MERSTSRYLRTSDFGGSYTPYGGENRKAKTSAVMPSRQISRGLSETASPPRFKMGLHTVNNTDTLKYTKPHGDHFLYRT